MTLTTSALAYTQLLDFRIIGWAAGESSKTTAKYWSISGTYPMGGEMVRLSDSLRSTHSADGAVILDVRRGRIFRFNRTGSRILQLLRSGAEEPEIVCMLVQEFSADPATAESDTNTFLTALRQNALIELRPQR